MGARGATGSFHTATLYLQPKRSGIGRSLGAPSRIHPAGLQEFAYIPTDLIPLLPLSAQHLSQPARSQGIPKRTQQPYTRFAIRFWIMLARCSPPCAWGSPSTSQEFLDGAWMSYAAHSPDPVNAASLACLCRACRPTDRHALSGERPVISWKLPRGQALAFLAQAWLTSQTFQ